MKKLIVLFKFQLLIFSFFSQPPQGFNYQAVMRNNTKTISVGVYESVYSTFAGIGNIPSNLIVKGDTTISGNNDRKFLNISLDAPANLSANNLYFVAVSCSSNDFWLSRHEDYNQSNGVGNRLVYELNANMPTSVVGTLSGSDLAYYFRIFKN